MVFSTQDGSKLANKQFAGSNIPGEQDFFPLFTFTDIEKFYLIFKALTDPNKFSNQKESQWLKQST